MTALVEQRATKASTKTWMHLHGADDEVLGGAASLWPSGHVGSGFKIHHYRTRSTRAMAFGGSVISLLMAVAIANSLLHGLKPWTMGDIIGSALVFAPIYAGTALFLGRYFFVSVRCEEGGVRKTGIWGERFLPWKEIESFEGNGCYFVMKGKRGSLRFGAEIADAAGLKEEVKRLSGIEYRSNTSAF